MNKYLFIASEVRSGSTFLAESIAYNLDEVFGYKFYDLANEKFSSLNDNSYENEILKIVDTLFLDKSGWASAKVMCSSLSVINRESRKSELVRKIFFGDNTYWIVIRRKHKIEQAVSLALARRSGLYHFYGDAFNSSDTGFHLKIHEIEDALRAIVLSDIYLNAFAETLSSNKSLEIFYEDFLENSEFFLNKIYHLCGFDLILMPGQPRDLPKIKSTAHLLKKQACSDFKFWLLENYHAAS